MKYICENAKKCRVEVCVHKTEHEEINQFCSEPCFPDLEFDEDFEGYNCVKVKE